MNFKALCSLIPLPVPPTDIGRKRTANISCARRFPERAPKTASRRYGLTLPVIIVFHSTHHSRHPARRTCLTHWVSDSASRRQSEGFGPSFFVSWNNFEVKSSRCPDAGEGRLRSLGTLF